MGNQTAEIYQNEDGSLHLKNVFQSVELDENLTTEGFSVVRQKPSEKDTIIRLIENLLSH